MTGFASTNRPLVAVLIALCFAIGGCTGSSTSSSFNNGQSQSGDSGGGDTGGGDTGGGDSGGDDGGAQAEAKVQGPLDPVQDQIVTGVIAEAVGSNAPDPMDQFSACLASAINSLVDAPDAMLAFAQAGPSPDYDKTQADVALSMSEFARKMANLAYALNGQSACSENHPETDAGNPFNPNVDPVTGSPVEPIANAADSLAAAAAAATAAEPNEATLSAMLLAVNTELAAMAGAFGALPPEVFNAPFAGPAMSTLATALADTQFALAAMATFDPVLSQAAVEQLTNNLVSNALTQSISTADVDAVTGQDFSGEIAGLAATLASTYGADLETTISGLFVAALGGVSDPVTNDTDGLVTQVTGGSSSFSNPFDGILADSAGNGIGEATDPLVATLMTGYTNLPLLALTAALSGNQDTTPLEQLAELGAADPAVVDAMLAETQALSDLGLPASSAFVSTVDNALGGTLLDLIASQL